MASFTLSDTVIIIICAGGVVLIVAVVLLLILCITSKAKDNNVRPIRPQPRRHAHIHVHEHRSRRPEMPKPPPYSEFPPDYHDWDGRDVSDLELANQNPSSSRGVRRTNIMRTRNGSPHPGTSARGRRSPERNSDRLPTSMHDTGRSHFQNEASVNRDTRRRNDISYQIQTGGGHSGDQRVTGRTAGNQVRNPAIILNPISASYNFSHNELVTNRASDLLPGAIHLEESPPPSNPAAEMRQEQRRQAPTTIQIRRLQVMTPSPPPAYEQ